MPTNTGALSEAQDSAFGMTLVSDKERQGAGYAFIGAVHDLVGSQRASTKSDLLLAAASQAVRNGDKTASEVHQIVNQIWPGANTDLASTETALRLGRELGVMTKNAGLGGTVLWSLTPRGVEEVDTQATWVSGLRANTRADLVSRAQQELGLTPSIDVADSWLEALVLALIEGIQSSQDAYFGRVDHAVGRRLVPRAIDQESVFARLDEATPSPITRDFLKGAALASFDPLDPFGNELVSLITTGCVLHSYVAGRDAAATLDRIGTPVGQRASLDTPVLLDLIGPARVRSNALVTLAAAVAAGWEVVVCEHYLDELSALLEREVPKVQEHFAEAHSRGIREEWYASLAEGQLPSYCVEVLRDGTYSRLSDFISAAGDLEVTLAELGVVVRPHGNATDREAVEKCRVALQTELDHGGGGRAVAAVERDSETMAMVWRRRRRQTGSEWPGGWIITSDRRIARAFRALQPNDPVPLTLSMAQWSTLLSATVPPAEVVELAAAAASQLMEEAMWLLPSRFPSDVALSLAKQIGPSGGGSDMDLRYAQLTLDGSLDDAGETRSAASLAADVLEARTSRRKTLQETELAIARRAQLESEERARAATNRATENAAEAVEARREAAEQRAESLKLAVDLRWARKRLVRVAVVIALGILAAGTIGAAIAFALPSWAAIVGLIGLLTIVLGGTRWCSDESAKATTVAVGATVEAIGVVTALVSTLTAD